MYIFLGFMAAALSGAYLTRRFLHSKAFFLKFFTKLHEYGVLTDDWQEKVIKHEMHNLFK